MSVVTVTSVGGDVVRAGAQVRVHSDDDEMEFAIVEPAEADASAGRVSCESPMCGALLGRLVGEQVTVSTPGGRCTARIVAILPAVSEARR
jgi:transcription elongation factor GreA